MKEYTFYVDEKTSVWTRTKHIVEARSFEEALNYVKQGEGEDGGTEVMYETQEWLDPEDNGGNCTVEIYDDNENVVYRNA